MGLQLAELFVDISADTDRLAADIGKAGGIMKGFVPIAGGIGVAAGAAFAAELAAKAGAALADMVKDGVNRAVEFETKMVGLGKATDLSGNKLAGLREEIFKMGREISGVSLDSLVDIATNAAKGGLDKGEIVEFTGRVAKLSAALDDIPADEIVESLLKINTAFKLPTESLVNLGSAFDKLADSGTLSARDLFQVVQNVSGIAAAAKLSVQDTAALSGALLNTGTSADNTADALRELFARITGSDGIKGAAEILGSTPDEFKNLVRNNPMQAIEQLLGKFKSMDLLEANAAFGKMGVGSQVAAGNLLKLAQSFDTVKSFSGLASSELKTNANATDSYNKVADTAAANQQKFANQVDEVKIRLSEKLLPALTEGVTAFGKIIQQFNQAEGAAKTLGKALTEIVQVLGVLALNPGTTLEIMGTEAKRTALNAVGAAVDPIGAAANGLRMLIGEDDPKGPGLATPNPLRFLPKSFRPGDAVYQGKINQLSEKLAADSSDGDSAKKEIEAQKLEARNEFAKGLFADAVGWAKTLPGKLKDYAEKQAAPDPETFSMFQEWMGYAGLQADPAMTQEWDVGSWNSNYFKDIKDRNPFKEDLGQSAIVGIREQFDRVQTGINSKDVQEKQLAQQEKMALYLESIKTNTQRDRESQPLTLED